MRLVQVTTVEVFGHYRLRLGFSDGLIRDVDLTRLGERGGVFVPLRDPEYFVQVRVDPEARTIVWPNGVDLDPLVLHGDYEPAEPDRQSA